MKVRVTTGIPVQPGGHGTLFPVFVAIGTYSTESDDGRKQSEVHVRVFGSWEDALKSGQDMLFQRYANVSVYRADEL